MPSGEALNQF